MKRNKYFLILIIFLFFISFPMFSGDIEFKISLNKETFIERESIWVKCQVRNNGSTPQNVLSVKHPIIRGMVFYLISEDSNSYLQDVSIKYFSAYEVLTILNPGESMESFANILEYYSSPNKSPLSGTNIYSLNPGRYKLFARYYTRWHGKDGREDIYSDTLKFEVIPPTGEEKEALELLEKGKHEELFEKYPESVYAPFSLHRYLVYECAISSLKRQEREEITKILMRQLEKYPNSPTIEYLDLQTLLQLHLDMGILKEGRTKLKNISEKNPDSYLSKSIKDFLKSTERNSIYSVKDTTKN